MQSEAVARRYAKALLDIAADETGKQVDAFGKDLETFCELFAKSAELRVVLTNPGIPLEQRHAVLAELLGKLRLKKMVENFLKLLLDRGRMGHITAIYDAYQGASDEAAGRSRGRVISARKMSAIQLKKMTAAVEKLVGKTVILESVEDEELLGGVRVEIEGQVFDGSVRAQLEQLRTQLTR